MDRDEAQHRVEVLLNEAEALATEHDIPFAAAVGETRTLHAACWTRACHGHGPGMAAVAGAVRGLVRGLPDEANDDGVTRG